MINKNRQEIWSNRSSQLSLTSYQQNSNRINPSNNQSLSNQNKFQTSNTDLRNNRLNVQNNLGNTTAKGRSNQNTSNLNKGTYVCLNLSDGTVVRAMIVGQGLIYGSQRDSYAIDVAEGSRRGQRYYLKPYQIDRVGECAEAYIPSPPQGVLANLNLNLLGQQIITELNIIRANPRAYADELAKLRYTKLGQSNNSVNAIAVGNDLVMRCYDNSQNCQDENL